jgi:DNA-binding IscR family transcriptional regulator
MDEVVLALEGSIAPMECFTAAPPGKVACSHEGAASNSCSTRLLWMRVQMGVIRALQGTTLAELVEFSRCGEPLPAEPVATSLPVVQAGP